MRHVLRKVTMIYDDIRKTKKGEKLIFNLI